MTKSSFHTIELMQLCAVTGGGNWYTHIRDAVFHDGREAAKGGAYVGGVVGAVAGGAAGVEGGPPGMAVGAAGGARTGAVLGGLAGSIAGGIWGLGRGIIHEAFGSKR